MHFFYILYSIKDNKLYKGYSADIGKRFIKHNTGGVKSTKYRRPLILIYTEFFTDKIDALNREKWAKSLEGGTQLSKILVQKNILNENLKLNIVG